MYERYTHALILPSTKNIMKVDLKLTHILFFNIN